MFACMMMLFSFASSAANEKEPNDGSNTATIISTDALHQGKLSSGKDIDWYKFTNKKDYFKLAFSIYSSVDYDDIGSYGWKLTIYTSDGKNIIKSYENITSEEGILLRVNRSIQVEGAFGVLKQDFGFRRFLTRGKKNIETQFFLLAFAFNINKLYNKKKYGRIGVDLFKLDAS